MNIPLADLKYAADPTLLVVENTYCRYSGFPLIVTEGVNHLGDIVVDTARKRALAASDPRLAKLIRDLFDKSNFFGSIERSYTGSTGFIAFRGTEKSTEWLDDFDFAFTDFNVGNVTVHVHSGFLKVYELARDSVVSQLSLLQGVNRLIVTGHSLGSAVATLCALELKVFNAFPKVDCWTFASPRVFAFNTKAFDKSIEQSLRVQNPLDIVTHVPTVLQGYRHVTGGLSIHPKLKDFHSLMDTYRPGLLRLIADSDPAVSAVSPSEEEALAVTTASGEDSLVRSTL